MLKPDNSPETFSAPASPPLTLGLCTAGPLLCRLHVLDTDPGGTDTGRFRYLSVAHKPGIGWVCAEVVAVLN